MQSRQSFKQAASRDKKRRSLKDQQAQLARALIEGKAAPAGFDSKAFQAAAESLKVKKNRESANCDGNCSGKNTVEELRQVFGAGQSSRFQRIKEVVSSLFFPKSSN